MKIKTTDIIEGSSWAKFWTALGCVFRFFRTICILCTLVAIGWGIWLLTTATTARAQSIESPSHYSLEYYVEGTRYIRTMNYDMAKLIEGTARDFGIKPAHLLALCIQEGSVANPNGHYFACDPTAVGDHGMARGAFQIHTGIHDISIRDAEHPYFAARWTAERLLRYGYEKSPKRAMMCHNGCDSARYGDTVWAIARTMKVVDPNLYLE